MDGILENRTDTPGRIALLCGSHRMVDGLMWAVEQLSDLSARLILSKCNKRMRNHFACQHIRISQLK